MKCIRLISVVVLTAALLLAPGSAVMANSSDSVLAQEPVVTVTTEAEEAPDKAGYRIQVTPDESAWTFRFLVPTAVVASAIAVVAVGVLYGVRVRGRYRVKQ